MTLTSASCSGVPRVGVRRIQCPSDPYCSTVSPLQRYHGAWKHTITLIKQVEHSQWSLLPHSLSATALPWGLKHCIQGNRFQIGPSVAASARSTTGRYCFHRCVSVHNCGGTPSPSHNISTGPMSFLGVQHWLVSGPFPGVPQWLVPGPFPGGVTQSQIGYPWPGMGYPSQDAVPPG